MIKLITIPFAGDMGFSFMQWKEIFSDKVKLCNIVYPGRGGSLEEDYAKSWSELIDNVYKQILKEVSDDDYVIFGHSMGSIVLYEIYYKLIKNKCKMPKFIIFSGSDIPKGEHENLSELDEEAFKEYFYDLGGFSSESLENEELLEYIFEVLREDVRLLDEYEYVLKDQKINCPVVVMNGKDDDLISTKEDWAKLTNKSCKYIEFSGGHFYLFKDNKLVVESIENMIKLYCSDCKVNKNSVAV